MAGPKIEVLHCESRSRPALPRYLEQSMYGQACRRRGHGSPEMPPGSEWLPKQSHGEAELLGEPWMAAGFEALQLSSTQDAEELPWKLMPCAMPRSSGATMVPLTDNEAVNKPAAGRPAQRRAVTTTRHIPAGVPLYYIEVEGNDLGQCSIGFMKQKVRFVDADTDAPSPAVSAASSAQSSPRTSRIRVSSRGHAASGRRGAQANLMADEESEGYYDDEDDEDGDEDEEEDGAEEDDEDNEELSDLEEDEFGDPAAGSDDEMDDASYNGEFDPHDVEDVYPHTQGGSVDMKLSPIGVTYRRTPRLGHIEETVLDVKKGRSIEPYFHWTPSWQAIELDGIQVSNINSYMSGGALELRPRRIGMLVDFVKDEILLTANGKLLATAGPLIVTDLSLALDDAKLFPVVAFPRGTVTVHLGDGRLPNDGFLFNVREYMRKYHDLDQITERWQVGGSHLARTEHARAGHDTSDASSVARSNGTGNGISSGTGHGTGNGAGNANGNGIANGTGNGTGNGVGNGTTYHDATGTVVKTGNESVKKLVDEAVLSHFMFYGYTLSFLRASAQLRGTAQEPEAAEKLAVAVRRRQRIRESVETGDIALTKKLVDYEALPREAQHELDLAEFVALARRFSALDTLNNGSRDTEAALNERLGEVLAMGRNLVASVGDNAELAQKAADAASIIFTQEPRPPHIARLYDSKAVTKLLDAILDLHDGIPEPLFRNRQRRALTALNTQKYLTRFPDVSYISSVLSSMYDSPPLS